MKVKELIEFLEKLPEDLQIPKSAAEPIVMLLKLSSKTLRKPL